MKHIIVCLLFAVCSFSALGAEDPFWWPAQRASTRYVECRRPQNLPEAVLAQSAAGLAAQAVNEGRWDELIWIANGSAWYGQWLRATVSRTGMRFSGEEDIWEIVSRMRDAGLVKGYVLYSRSDASLNPATVYAGQLGCVLIEQSLGLEAQRCGLRMCYDARYEASPAACFTKNREGLSRRMIVAMKENLPFNRDLAVAHRTMVYYGVDSAYRAMLAQMEPLTPVVGWNSGPESEHVGPPAEFGLFNTASDYCSNLAFLSAEAQTASLEKAKSIDPRRIDFDAEGSCHAFVMSDGDNMQWTMDAFFSDDFYLNAACRRFAMNWTSCAVNISQMSPATWAEIVRRQTDGSTIAEFSGGYQYADIFASELPDRWDALRRYARQTGEHMHRTGVKVLHLMMRHGIGADDAMHAYRIYAEEIPQLTGIVAIQYNPYHGGNGAVYWVENREGISIPVVTARYSLWGKITQPGFGRPDQTAERINADAAAGESLGWTIVHAWSRYAKDGKGAVADADNDDRTAARGVTAVAWCVERLDPVVRVVSLEELLWRIRMKHDPHTTRKIIENL